MKVSETLRKFQSGDYGGHVVTKVGALAYHSEMSRIEMDFDIRRGQEIRAYG